VNIVLLVVGVWLGLNAFLIAGLGALALKDLLLDRG
jgi:hypothetical protein